MQYEGLGLGRAATPTASAGSKAGGEESDVGIGESRSRRTSLSPP